MRIRSQRDDKTYPVDYLWEGNGYAVVNHYDGWDSFNIINVMQDAPLPRYRRKPDSFAHPCEHEKWEYRGATYQPWYGDNGLRVLPAKTVMPCLHLPTLRSFLPSLPDAVLRELSREAFNDFSTRFPSEVSISEFTGGLLELKSLIPKLTGNILKDLAALHLNKTFGWDSLLSDLKSLRALLSRVEDRLRWLRSTRGKPVSLGFYRRDILPPTGVGSIIDLEPIRSWGTRYTFRSFTMEFRAGATLTQNLDFLDGFIGYIRAIAGGLGLNNPLRAAWEVLPFSFVVDYFFNVSDRLTTLATIQPAEPWVLSNVTTSLKAKAVIDVSQRNVNVVNELVPNNDQLLGPVHYTWYKRFVGLPLDINSVDVPSLDASQLALLGALLAANSHR